MMIFDISVWVLGGIATTKNKNPFRRAFLKTLEIISAKKKKLKCIMILKEILSHGLSPLAHHHPSFANVGWNVKRQ